MKDYVLLEPLKVDSFTEYEFRRKLREKKCKAKMVKNALAKKVFTENGIAVDVWAGPTVLIWGADSIKELSNTVDGLLKELQEGPEGPGQVQSQDRRWPMAKWSRWTWPRPSRPARRPSANC